MKQQISTAQAILLLVNTIIPTAILTVPSIAIGSASQDSWISIIIATACGIIFALLIAAVSRQNPGMPFFSFVESRMGRTVSIIVGILLVQYYMITTAVASREFVNFLTEKAIPNTPIFFLIAVSLSIALYAVSQGIEVIARVSFIVFVISIIFLPITVGLLMNQMHLHFLLPVGTTPFTHILQGGSSVYSLLSEVSILLLLSPYLTKPSDVRKIGVWSVIIAGSELLIFAMMIILVFGPKLPMLMKYPTFTLIESVEYGRFVERIDSLFIAVWIATAYVKICIFFFGTMYCFVHTFRIHYEKPFLIVLGLFVLLTALYSWPSNSSLVDTLKYASTPLLLTFNVLLPLALWIGLRFTKRKKLTQGG